MQALLLFKFKCFTVFSLFIIPPSFSIPRKLEIESRESTANQIEEYLGSDRPKRKTAHQIKKFLGSDKPKRKRMQK